MTSTTVLILGAGSDIARAVAREYAARTCNLILAARQSERLEPDLADLTQRGAASVVRAELDILNTNFHRKFIDNLGELPDIVICFVGLLGDQKAAETDPTQADLVMRTNYLAPALLLGEFANQMEKRGSGMIIGVSSVAGDRGRASNYLYGSAKAGFTAFLSGLRNRLATKNVHVLTIKPGFVATRMTTDMKLPPYLTAQPKHVARAMIKAADKKADILYTLPVWRFIMMIIQHIPEKFFKKMKLSGG